MRLKLLASEVLMIELILMLVAAGALGNIAGLAINELAERRNPDYEVNN